MTRNRSRDRANGRNDTQEERNTEQSESPWAKSGVAGQVQPAKRAAPDDAGPLEILAVAHVAYHENRAVESLWREINNQQLDNAGGAE
jgi:hypothetical protein